MKNLKFLMHPKMWILIEPLSLSEKGALLESMFRYVIYGVEPMDIPPVVLMAFRFFKKQRDEDVSKYKEICNIRREAANKRWHKFVEKEQ